MRTRTRHLISIKDKPDNEFPYSIYIPNELAFSASKIHDERRSNNDVSVRI